jgi:hypothetical protein
VGPDKKKKADADKKKTKKSAKRPSGLVAKPELHSVLVAVLMSNHEDSIYYVF